MNRAVSRARTRRSQPVIARTCAALSLVCLPCMGCSDGSGGPAKDDPDPGETEPVYAMMTQVYSVDDRSVYITLSNSLDIDDADLDGAREFPGVANMEVIDGRLFVSDGLRPTITEFSISDELRWIEGRSLSFGQYPLGDNANFYYQFIVDEHTVYLPYEASKRILWDPTEMAIVGSKDASALPFGQDGLILEAGGNRNGVRYDAAVLQAFFYHDEQWFEYGRESLVAVYDSVAHEESAILRVPCPALSIATRDEAGYTYFSSWDFAGTQALYGLGPAPCIARVGPDLTLDRAWTTDLTDLTGGRYLSNFRYVGGGRAIANVLHHELLDADFSGPFEPDVADAINAGGPHWRLWSVDLANWSARPIEGIDVSISSGAQFAVLDGRTFVFLPFDEWSKTVVYELDDEGRATERFRTTGDVFKWLRVR